MLNFNNDIQSDSYVDKFGDTYVVFTDGDNNARFIKIDIGEEPQSLFPSITSIPKGQVTRVNETGGNLKAGSYYFALAYKHADGTITNFYDVVGPVLIANSNPDNTAFYGNNSSITTSKSITLDLPNLDTNYKSLLIAVIPVYDGIIDAIQILPEININSDSYTYSGNEGFIPGALEEIQIDKAYYEKPKTVHINEDTIYLGNMNDTEQFDYQSYANNIIIKPSVKLLPEAVNDTHDLSNSYKDPINATYNKGFKRGEVYAFYISWLFKEGGETPAYHIPGRAAGEQGSNPGEETLTHIAATANTRVEWDSPTLISGHNLTLTYNDKSVTINLNQSGLNDATSAADFLLALISLINATEIEVNAGFLTMDTNSESPTYEKFGLSFTSNLQGSLGNKTLSLFYSEASPSLSFNSQSVGSETVNLNLSGGSTTGSAVESTGNLTRMGYWANQNELYPDTALWGSLRNTRVRHHIFPEVSQVSLRDGDSYKALGIRLENVELPAGLSDNVVGYKVYYAKRTELNKRILDQAIAIEAKLDSGVFVTNGNNAAINAGTSKNLYLHPFNYLRNRKNIGSLTNLKAINRTEASLVDVSSITDITVNTATHNVFPTPVGDDIRTVVGKAYIDTAEVDTITNVSSFGFPSYVNNVNNIYGESKLLVSFDSSENVYTRTGNTDYYIMDLFSYKTDVYNSFDLQELVSTNYIHTNLNDLNSDTILGGDIYLCRYRFRANGTGTKSTSKDKSTIHNFICESTDNINYRTIGVNVGEIFNPGTPSTNHVGAFGFKDGEPSTFDTADTKNIDNWFGYNESYSDQNRFKFPTINSKFVRRTEKYPTRIIRGKDALSRTFLQDDYIDLSTKRGELVKLTTFNNILIPHMKRALVRTRGREDLQIGDIRAFLGSGDIFSAKPDELVYTEEGFGGIDQARHSISTPFGYFFLDVKSRNFYRLDNEGLKDLTDSLTPMFRDTEFDEISLGYDPYYERVIFSFNGNETYSYSPKINNWVSRHSYCGSYYFNSFKDCYSMCYLQSHAMFLHNHGNRGQFYGDYYSMDFTYISNNEPLSKKKASSLYIQMELFDNNGNIILDKLFDRFVIANSHQTTNIRDIEYFDNTGNNPYIGVRRTLNKWFINAIRETSSNWFNKRRLEDHWHRVRLIKDQDNTNKTLHLYATDIITKDSIR